MSATAENTGLLSGSLGRRRFVLFAALSLCGSLRAASTRFSSLPGDCAALEKTNSGRLGVAVLDTATGERSGYRADERFPMCSTFKFLLASAVLERVDRRDEKLDRALAIPPKPLLSHSPLTEPHAGGTMTIAALCQAVLIQSDNTAANALLETIGGPAAITKFCRSISDRVTRLDRTELALNESLAGDPRDTTSPAAMVGNLKTLLLGSVLSPQSRNQLTLWMQGCLTGRDRLRAQLPAGWRAADKTGANGEHTSNDIAVFWPAGRPPVIVAAYITQCPGPESKRAAMLAEVGTMVAEQINERESA
jgi:beta-lactamase class A